MAEVDTSLYKEVMNADAFEFQNKLLATQRATWRGPV